MTRESFEEKARKEKLPIPFAIYKGVKGKFGALRLSFKRPYTSSDPKKSAGILFLESAPSDGPGNYDWENNKIVMALGLTDIGQILHFFKNPNAYKVKDSDEDECKISIIHDPDAGTANSGSRTKTFSISKKPKYTNFMMNSYMKRDSNQPSSATTTLSPGEAIVLCQLLEESIKNINSWGIPIGEDISAVKEELLQEIDDLKEGMRAILKELRK